MPNQSDFLRVDETVIGPGIGDHEGETVEMIRRLTYFVDEQFNQETYDSCKNVQFPALSDTIMGLLCGPWGSKYCTPKRWWTYLGTESNGYSPFDILYDYGNSNTTSVDGFTYHSNLVDSCKEPPSYADKPDYNTGCRCVDCEDACSSLDDPQYEHYDTESWMWHIEKDDIILYSVSMGVSVFLVCAGFFMRNLGDGLLNIITKIFTIWGRITATYPKTVILVSVLIAGGLSCGMYKLTVTTDPIELWASPESRSRVEKDFFDTEFRPFYRAAQVIIKSKVNPEEGIDWFDYTDMFDETRTFGPVFNKKFLLEVLDLQRGIENVSFEYENKKMTLEDVCNRPLGEDGCNIQNIWAYWQNDETQLDRVESVTGGTNYTYLDHFLECSRNPSLMAPTEDKTCMAPWGGPVSAYYILGGFIPNGNTGFPEDPEYFKSTAIVMSIIVDNYDPKSTDPKDVEGLKKAMLWEEAYINFLKDYEANKMPNSYMEIAFYSERSVQDELSRETYGDLATIAISYILMFLYITIALGQHSDFSPNGLMIESKFTLGLFGVMIVLLSVFASIGIFALIDVPATLIIFEIIPFLVLAVGVDNIFILVQTYQRDVKKDYESHADHVGRIVGEVAPSMLLSSAAESTCFFLGALSDMPAVRAFALYAGMALMIDFLMQITCFVAVISLDMRRQESAKYDLFCCVQGKKMQKKSLESVSYRFFKELYAPALMNTIVRVVVLVAFLALFGFALSEAPQVEVGLDQEVSMPRDSFILKYFLYMKDFLSVGPPVYFVLNNTNSAIDLSNSSIQGKLCMSHQLCQSDSVGALVSQWSKRPKDTFIATSAMNWVDTYRDWVANDECCRTYKDQLENGVKIPCPTEEDKDKCEGCGIKQDFTSAEFAQTIKWFLEANPRDTCTNGGHAAFADGVQLKEKALNTQLQRWMPPVNQTRYEIINSNMMAFHTILKTSKDYYTALKRARELTDKMTEVMNEGLPVENHVNVFPYSVFYVFYEQYLTMWADAMRSIFISLLSIFVVTLVLMGFDVISSLIIIFTIILILTNIMAVMKWWSITLNAVSLVNLVMAVGISVEFCSHITRLALTFYCVVSFLFVFQ